MHIVGGSVLHKHTPYKGAVMNDTDRLMVQLDAIFSPESIAVVGVPQGMKTGKLFLMALIDQGFPGTIYPVHPTAEEIDGLKAYPTVSSIPGRVDLAIILVSHDRTLSIVRECAAKGVKGAILFSAGYTETGTDEGRKMQTELTRIARSSGMRILGPNCMGLYAPRTGLSNFPELPPCPRTARPHFSQRFPGKYSVPHGTREGTGLQQSHKPRQ